MIFQLFCINFLIFVCNGGHLEALSDDVLFQINWPGHPAVDINKLAPPGVEYNSDNAFVITSSNNEKYQCSVPSLSDSESTRNSEKASSESVVELLSPLLKSDVCTYLIDSYWTYELCHGKHVRQFHEERTKKSDQTEFVVKKDKDGKLVMEPSDGKQELIKTTEYFLGYLKQKPDDENLPKSSAEVPKKNINGVKTPYFAINMTDGTTCDLKDGSGRKSSILYVCSGTPRATLLSVVETTSCEYELVVLSPELCKHPLYKVQAQTVNQIQCVPLDDAPAKPQALTQFIQNQAKDSSFPSRTVQPPSDDDTPKKDDLRRVEATSISPLVDQNLLREFLSGSYCLQGGTGWWRFEFCYGQYVQQFHDDKKTGRATITVGRWDEDAHNEWADKKTNHPVLHKREKGSTKVLQVAHFYGNGDVCDETKKAREVVVRMNCKKDGSSPHSVTIYMLEPTTCSYILGVESMIFCDLLETADEFGLFTLQ